MPYTQKDKDQLAEYLSTFPKDSRTKPTTFKEGVASGRLANHTWASWHTHYRDNREDIDRRITLVKRKRAREFIWQGRDASNSGAVSASGGDKKVRDDSKGKATDTKGKKKRTSSSTTSANSGRSRNSFTEKDWSRLIKTLYRRRKENWPSGEIYEHLAAKVRPLRIEVEEKNLGCEKETHTFFSVLPFPGCRLLSIVASAYDHVMADLPSGLPRRGRRSSPELHEISEK